MTYRPGSYTVTYPQVRVHAERRGKCPVCGRRVRRNYTFTNTVNPWNRNPDGSVRTTAEVRAKLREDAAAWTPDFTHAGCETDG